MNGFDWYGYVVLPLLIFLFRMTDVSIGTIRLITLSKGRKGLTALLGFVELLIWLIAIGQIFHNLTNWVYYVAYAGGFAAGNYVGITIEEKIAMGSVMLQVVTSKPADEFVQYLKNNNYGFTNVLAQGSSGPVNILWLVIKRKHMMHMIKKLQDFHPKAFYTIGEVKTVQEGIFPRHRVNRLIRWPTLRKSK